MSSLGNSGDELSFTNSISKSLDYALSLAKYLSKLNSADQKRVVKMMEMLLLGPPRTKHPIEVGKRLPKYGAMVHRRRKYSLKLDGVEPEKRRKRKHSLHTHQPEKTADVQRFVDFIPVDGTDRYMIFRLDPDSIMHYMKNHIVYRREPKLPVKETKTSELRESFTTYCGQKKTMLKNWLYDV